MSSRRCKIHYRRLDRSMNNFPDGTLASALSKALDHKQPSGARTLARVSDRIALSPSNQEHRRFLNHSHAEADLDLVFGSVCLFSPGDMQALLELEEKEDHASLADTLAAWNIAEQKAPAGKEYLHAITYWMAIGDHFYQIQHAALPAKAMEEYFTWLLKDKTAKIGTNHYVALQWEFDRSQVGKDLGDLRTVEIGGFVPETVNTQDSFQTVGGKVIEVESHETIGDKMAQTFQKGRKILEDLLGDVEANKIIASMPPEAALEVKVSFGFRATKRKIQKEFMANLASGLRHMADGEIKVRGRDGLIKGDDARLSADMNIKRLGPSSSLLELEDVLRQMKEVHRRFLYDGHIAK